MPDVSSARAERLVNLVLCLLSTRQFLPAERIRATVPGYADAPNDEAFLRMFERDKNELRELGVPLETGRKSGFDTTDGYRIARQDYELGEIDLEPDEAAAVALAARLWDSPDLAGAAHGAVLKLRAAGVEVDEDEAGPVQPRVRAAEPAFAPLLAAVQAGRVVTFPHRRGGPAGELTESDRRALGRRVGAGPLVSRGSRPGPRRRPLVPALAHRRPRDGREPRRHRPCAAGGGPAGGDRRRGSGPPPVIGTARCGWPRVARTGCVGWAGCWARWRRADRRGDELEIELRSLGTVARWIAGYGPDVAVLYPPELAYAVRGAGRAVAAAQASSPASRRSRRDRVGWRDRRAHNERRPGGAAAAAALARALPAGPPRGPIAVAAADFGIAEKQLRRDLELLWMCGLPGYGPGDLMDLSFTGDTSPSPRTRVCAARCG